MSKQPVERCPVCGKPMSAKYRARIAHRQSKAHVDAEKAILRRVAKRNQP